MQNDYYYDLLEERKQEQMPVVLTPAEAMDILGVGKNTMYRLLSSGKLPAVRLGRMWRIKIHSIDELLDQTR